ncbi:MAG: TIGR01906 family membrane protein [Eubacteriales bacterium]|nr:TIGR01906 family membrane protein [Eubacteriales bacterium]
MRKLISVGMATLASMLLIFIVVFTSIGFVIDDETFVNNEFTKLAISSKMGVSNSDLVTSFNRLVDYMEGDAPDINVTVTVNGEQKQMFDYPQEAEHMADVQKLYTTIASYRDVSVLVMLILFLFAAVFNFRKAPQYLAQGYLSGSFVFLLIFGFLGTWAALDFSNFWTFFHEMLFWNDLWLFDGTQSRMINMLPEQIFADIVARIGLYSGIVIVVLMAVSIIGLVLASDGYKRRKAVALARKKARDNAVSARKKARDDARNQLEEEKRLAEKRARIAAHKAKKQAAAEAAAQEAEQERLREEKRAKKRAAAQAAAAQEQQQKATTAAQREARPAREQAPAQQKQAKKPPAQAAKQSKKKANVHDDTGFLDD